MKGNTEYKSTKLNQAESVPREHVELETRKDCQISG